MGRRAGSSTDFPGGGPERGRGVHRHTHRGLEGPAATFGKSWLSPGEESEGKRLIEPRVRSGRKGVWGG